MHFIFFSIHHFSVCATPADVDYTVSDNGSYVVTCKGIATMEYVRIMLSDWIIFIKMIFIEICSMFPDMTKGVARKKWEVMEIFFKYSQNYLINWRNDMLNGYRMENGWERDWKTCGLSTAETNMQKRCGHSFSWLIFLHFTFFVFLKWLFQLAITIWNRRLMVRTNGKMAWQTSLASLSVFPWSKRFCRLTRFRKNPEKFSSSARIRNSETVKV